MRFLYHLQSYCGKLGKSFRSPLGGDILYVLTFWLYFYSADKVTVYKSTLSCTDWFCSSLLHITELVRRESLYFIAAFTWISVQSLMTGQSSSQDLLYDYATFSCLSRFMVLFLFLLDTFQSAS